MLTLCLNVNLALFHRLNIVEVLKCIFVIIVVERLAGVEM